MTLPPKQSLVMTEADFEFIEIDVQEQEEVQDMDGFEEPPAFFYETVAEQSAPPTSSSLLDLTPDLEKGAYERPLSMARSATQLSESTAGGSTFAQHGSICSSPGISPDAVDLQYDDDDSQDSIMGSEDGSLGGEYVGLEPMTSPIDPEFDASTLPKSPERLRERAPSNPKNRLGGKFVPRWRGHEVDRHGEDKENIGKDEKGSSETDFRPASAVLQDMRFVGEGASNYFPRTVRNSDS